MQESISKVAEYHRVLGSPVLDSPKIPDRSRIALRVKLLDEDVSKLEEAGYSRSLTGVLNALCDLQHTINGTILEFGLQGVFEEALKEVHDSDMSMFCSSTKDAQESIKRLQFKNVDAYYKLIGGKHVIMRCSDDKILKGMNYFEPKLKLIIENFKKENRSK